MARKTSKLLIGAALIGVAIGGGIAYLNKCKKEDEYPDEDFDEFPDDFDEDLEEETTASASREYVTIPKDEKNTEEEESGDAYDSAKPDDETADNAD